MTVNEIDLNADLGEGFGIYSFGSDDELLASITSANIACGYHAGDPHRMRETVGLCLSRGVAIGAHPGLPDRLGFGRREMRVTPAEASDFVLYQTGALQAIAQVAGGRVSHVKLHGALYHMASADDVLADAIADGLRRLDESLLLFGLPGSRLEAAARGRGLRFVAEGFADRAYAPDGSLAPRTMPGAVLLGDDRIAAQAVALATRGETKAIDGSELKLHVRTICLHGDEPGAAARAALIRRTLSAAGVRIRPPGP